MARLTPVMELAPEGGQVVVTRFECPNLSALIAVRLLHVRLKRIVRKRARGFVGVAIITDWRRRTMLTVSLWQSLDSIYSMGDIPAHVDAVRMPAHLGVATKGGVFCFVGDWRRVLFGGKAAPGSPLHPLTPPLSAYAGQADTFDNS